MATHTDTDTMAPGISTRERLRLRLNLRPRLIPTTSTTDSTATDTLPMVPTHTLMEPTAPTDTHTHMATATHTDMVPTDTHTATDTTTRLLKSQPFDLIIPKNTIKMSSYPFYLNKKKHLTKKFEQSLTLCKIFSSSNFEKKGTIKSQAQAPCSHCHHSLLCRGSFYPVLDFEDWESHSFL